MRDKIAHICETLHIYAAKRTYMRDEITHICATAHVYVRLIIARICEFLSISISCDPYMLVHICRFLSIYVGFRPYMLHIYVDFCRYMLYPPPSIYVHFRRYMFARICWFSTIYVVDICAKTRIYAAQNAHI